METKLVIAVTDRTTQKRVTMCLTDKTPFESLMDSIRQDFATKHVHGIKRFVLVRDKRQVNLVSELKNDDCLELVRIEDGESGPVCALC